MLNKCGESQHPSIVPHIKGKAFRLLPLGMILDVGFITDTLCQVEEVPFYIASLGIDSSPEIIVIIVCLLAFCFVLGYTSTWLELVTLLAYHYTQYGSSAEHGRMGSAGTEQLPNLSGVALPHWGARGGGSLSGS